jgi:hypothetical protein
LGQKHGRVPQVTSDQSAIPEGKHPECRQNPKRSYSETLATGVHVARAMKYPLSANELGALLHTVEWLNSDLSEIITLLRDRQGDDDLLKLAESAHGHLESLLARLQHHYASLERVPRP